MDALCGRPSTSSYAIKIMLSQTKLASRMLDVEIRQLRTRSPLKRLLSTLITVLLNSATLTAVAAWAGGQHRYTELRFLAPSFSIAASVDKFGWQVFSADEMGIIGYQLIPQVEEDSYASWRADAYAKYSLAHGLLWEQFPRHWPNLIGLKHWLILSALSAMQLIHHRRLLIRHRPKHRE